MVLHLEFCAAGVLCGGGVLDVADCNVIPSIPLRPEARDRLAHDPLGARSTRGSN